MARWEPNAIGRLQDAALALYRERGYDETTVADIAARAGLTRRTFFRYFTHKREVLFYGAEGLETFVVESVAGAPPLTPAIDAVAAALDAVARASDDRPGFADFSRQRQALIDSCAELRERDLMKLASLGSALAKALDRRGVGEPAASLAAEAGVAAFKIAFERWVRDARRGTLRQHLREALDQLKAVAAGQVALPGESRRVMARPTSGRRRTSRKPASKSP
jgi:AcrR family transcriptional regulator